LEKGDKKNILYTIRHSCKILTKCFMDIFDISVSVYNKIFVSKLISPQLTYTYQKYTQVRFYLNFKLKRSSIKLRTY